MANVETAISLMKMALALLGTEGEDSAAVMLQHSISIAEREPIPRTVEEADELLNAPAARTAVRRSRRA